MKDVFTLITIIIVILCLLITIGSLIYGFIKSIVHKRKLKKELKENEQSTTETVDNENKE